MLSLIGLMAISSSCNKTKTYAEYLSGEKDAIEDFIRDSGIVVLKSFPSDGKFKPKEFYKDEASGVYFNVIERGDVTLDAQGNLDNASKVAAGEEVYVRYEGMLYFSNDTVRYSNMNPVTNPMPDSFIYRTTATTLNISSYYSETTAGWTIPLKYVGHNGRVKMIIPFLFGWSYDRSNGRFVPVYYDQVIFRLANHIK